MSDLILQACSYLIIAGTSYGYTCNRAASIVYSYTPALHQPYDLIQAYGQHELTMMTQDMTYKQEVFGIVAIADRVRRQDYRFPITNWCDGGLYAGNYSINLHWSW